MIFRRLDDINRMLKKVITILLICCSSSLAIAQQTVPVPTCPVSGSLILNSGTQYLVSQKTYRDCPVLIQSGAKIKISVTGQLTFAQKVTLPFIAENSSEIPTQIFDFPEVEEIEDKWWVTPVVFLKRQTLYPEWFGATQCSSIVGCPDSSRAFQLAVNSLMAGKKIRLQNILPEDFDNSVGGTITTARMATASTNPLFYNFANNVTISRDHITIDLRRNALHREGTTPSRFICSGDVNRSLDIYQTQNRTDGFLQNTYPNDMPGAENKRRANALYGCNLKRIRFGVPITGSSDLLNSVNVSGIALMRWVTDGLVEDVRRYGKGYGGIILAVCQYCKIKQVDIFGASDGRFDLITTQSNPPVYQKYYWSRTNIGILLHLSDETEIDGVNIGRGPFFAALQVKGGNRNKIRNTKVMQLKDPEKNFYCLKPPSNECNKSNIPPEQQTCTAEGCRCNYNSQTKVCELPTFTKVLNSQGVLEGKAPNGTIIPIDYGSRTAFWSRGDSPYITPTGKVDTVTFSYPWSTLSFREADPRRKTYDTTWSNLQVLDSKDYVAYSFEESRKASYTNISAENVRIGMLLTRTHPSSLEGEGQVTIDNMSINTADNTIPLSSIFPILFKYADAQLLKPDNEKDLTEIVKFQGVNSFAIYKESTLPGRKACVGYYPYSLLTLVNNSPSPVKLISNPSLLECRLSNPGRNY
jgi:hypothetical protein